MKQRPTLAARTPEQMRSDYRWAIPGILFFGLLGVGTMQFNFVLGCTLIFIALLSGVSLAMQETEFRIASRDGKTVHTSGASAMQALLDEIEFRTVIGGERLGFVTVTPERSLTRRF